MDQRILIFLMSLTTFIAYPFLSADDRKHVAPLATQVEDAEPEEIDDDEDPISMDDDEEECSLDPQINKENKKNRKPTTDPQSETEDNY